MLCQVSRAGLTGQLCQGICADAPSAPHGLLGMSNIASLIALQLILVIYSRNMHVQLFDEAHGAMRLSPPKIA